MINKLSNISAIQLYQLMKFVTSIIIGLLLVKSGMSLGDIGWFEAFIFMGNIFSFFWSIGIKNALLSFVSDIDSSRIELVVFNAFFLLVMLGLLVGILGWTFGDNLLSLAGFENFQYLSLALIYMVFVAPSILNEILLMLNDRQQEIVRYGVFIHILLILAVIGILSLGGDIYHVMLAYIVWAIVKFIFSLIIVREFGTWRIDRTLIAGFVIFALPLIITVVLGNGMEYVDGMIVGRLLENEDFAIFRYGAREFPLITIMELGIVSAMIPVVLTTMSNSMIEIKSHVTRMMKWMYPMAGILILLSPILYPMVYSDDFRLSADIFNIYLLILCTRVVLPQIFVLAHKYNYTMLIISSIELIINVSLSLWWIDIWGLMGIAYATVVAYAIQKIILVSFVRYKFHIELSKYLDVKKYVVYSLALVIVYLISLTY